VFDPPAAAVVVPWQGVDCELMMETSGHGAMRSNHYLDDGSYLALVAIIAFVRSKLQSGGRDSRKWEQLLNNAALPT
jgi:hypothetical protein